MYLEKSKDGFTKIYDKNGKSINLGMEVFDTQTNSKYTVHDVHVTVLTSWFDDVSFKWNNLEII